MLHTKESQAQTKKELQMVVLNDHRFAVEERNGNISFNLTMMAKPYGKSRKPSNWLRSEESMRYIEALTKSQKRDTADLVEVRHGGKKGEAGTWANDYRIAIRFAQWLDMRFAIAVDELIYKLLTKQATVVEPFKGVNPVVDGHKAWYCYLDVLKAIGYSTKSGSVAQRKHRYKNHFKKFFGRNFIDLELCELLSKQSEVRQLQLDLVRNLAPAIISSFIVFNIIRVNNTTRKIKDLIKENNNPKALK